MDTQMLVVAVDDSKGARAALRWAVSFVDHHRAQGRPIDAVLVHAWSPPNPYELTTLAMLPDDVYAREAEQILERVAAEVPGAESFTRVARRDMPKTAMLEEADRVEADLIVIGTRGRGPIGRLLLGSVSRSVAATATRPVAVIPLEAGPFGAPTIVGFDGSAGGEAALRWALDNTDGPVLAVTAWSPPHGYTYETIVIDPAPFHDATARRQQEWLEDIFAGEPAPRVVPILSWGDPREVLSEARIDDRLEGLTDTAEKGTRASQVVVGARSHHGVLGALLGSVATYTVCHAGVPVIVVPPAEPKAADGSSSDESTGTESVDDS